MTTVFASNDLHLDFNALAVGSLLIDFLIANAHAIVINLLLYLEKILNSIVIYFLNDKLNISIMILISEIN